MNHALRAELQGPEAVLRSGGEAVIVPPGELTEHDRVAAVLRY